MVASDCGEAADPVVPPTVVAPGPVTRQRARSLSCGGSLAGHATADVGLRAQLDHLSDETLTSPERDGESGGGLRLRACAAPREYPSEMTVAGRSHTGPASQVRVVWRVRSRPDGHVYGSSVRHESYDFNLDFLLIRVA